MDKIKIFLVDDDVVFIRLLEIEFMQAGNFIIETFPTGEKCMESISQNPNIVVLDYHLDGMDPTAMTGITTLDLIKAYNHEIPVIMLSSQDKIEVAVNCMHHHAFDYVVKSETAFMRLKQIISNIFKIRKIENQLQWYMDRM